MRSKFGRFLFIGYVFAFVVESINMGIVQGDWLGMIITVLVFYGLIISISYFTYQKGVSKPLHFLIFGFLGLLLEWLIFQPNPFSGKLWLVIFVNLGMFSHWATIAFAPRLLLDEKTPDKLKKNFLTIMFVGMGVVFGTTVLSGNNYSTLIIGNIVVYTILLGSYVKYIRIR